MPERSMGGVTRLDLVGGVCFARGLAALPSLTLRDGEVGWAWCSTRCLHHRGPNGPTRAPARWGGIGPGDWRLIRPPRVRNLVAGAESSVEFYPLTAMSMNAVTSSWSFARASFIT